jgi:hypothetical protein
MRAQTALHRAAGALANESLTIAEKSALGVALYDAMSRNRPMTPGLYDWEEGWFRRRLPPVPARLLLGAAGAGREMRWLVDAGYVVTAFEPAAHPAAECRRLAGQQADVFVASYEDVADAVLDGHETPASQMVEARYDAVILGWGSLSHVIDPEDRRRLIQACDRLCPNGPLLATFVLYWGRPAQKRSRAERAGKWLGGRIRELRKVADDTRELMFAPWSGFAHAFTQEEIEALAQAADRQVVWGDARAAYPHATMIPGHQP